MYKTKNTTEATNESGFAHILIILVALVVIGCVGFAGWQVFRSKHHGDDGGAKTLAQWLSKCSGTGSVSFTHAPMDLKDVGSIVPAGSLAGAHVTPIDHLYFYPKDMQHRDAAPVYAMADGFIVNYEERTQRVDTGQSQQGEYQLYFQHNCNTLSYFDLMTSLSPDIKKAVQGKRDGMHIPVKAGQLVGYVGAQSLDTAIYNSSMTLSGFVNPDSYKSEPVKLHTDDFFKYFSGSLKTDMLALNLRKVEPYGGKIDYDVDGKLRGNWFKEGTNGYAGLGNLHVADSNGQGYWSGHFAIVPDAIDPTILDISFGNYNGKAQQFSALTASPDPATVGVSDGVVKYELVQYQQSGPSIGGSQMGQPVRNTQVQGVVLLQMTGPRTMKMEAFPKKTASQVTGFTSNAQTYVR